MIGDTRNNNKDEYRYVVSHGSMVSGSYIYGPFDSWSEAQAYRDKMTAHTRSNADIGGYGSYSVFQVWKPKAEGLPEAPKTPEAKTCGCCEHGQ